jgi:outer membrane protein OmpA-like peptidoglycan-associated protein
MTKKIKRAGKRNAVVLLSCMLATSGCAIDPKTGQASFKETFASEDPCSNNSRNIGLVAGTVLGAVLGHQLKNKGGALAGAGVGALVGGLVGHDMDRKKCELSKLAKKYALDMTFVEVKAGNVNPEATEAKSDTVGLSVSIRDQDSNGHFQVGSDSLSPNAQKYFTEIANEYSYPQQLARLPANASAESRQAVELLKTKRLLIIGHTDDTGNSQLNADLSERRAKALATVFKQAGVSPDNLFFQGAGETLPVADNRSSEGRAKNRRVEIVDLTDDTVFHQYLSTRSARTDFYRVEVARPAQAEKSVSVVDRQDVKKDQRLLVAKKMPPKIPVAPLPQVSTSTPATQAQFDFNGKSSSEKIAALDIGPLASPSSFNILPLAQANDTPLARSCEYDKPRIANGVKSFRDSKEIATADYMPGLYGTSWTDNVNGHLVALTRVAVLRDGGAPAGKPQLLVYKNYTPGSKARPDYSVTPEVNTYKGQKALLYRVFVGGPINCLDIVIPNSDPNASKESWLYYDSDGKPLRANFNPRKLKS